MQRKFGTIALTAALLSAGAAHADNGFVAVKDSHFERNGQRYMIAGANFWYGGYLGAPTGVGQRARLVKELDRLKSLGINNVRVLAVSEKTAMKSAVSPATTSAPGHYDEQLPGLRRSLELLEVSGPAIAFALTVAALMVAFDPSVFEERRTAQFAGHIGLAMAATACGLLMRILSFSLDRTVEHWLRLQSDEDGFAVLPSPGGTPAQQPTAAVPTVVGSSGATR